MLTFKMIIEKISRETGLDPRRVRLVIKSLNKIVSRELAEKRSCRVFGLGTFIPAKMRKRIGRNPQTGDSIKVPGRYRVRFRPGKDVRSGLDYATARDRLQDMANLMVSELLLYNSAEIDEGIRNDDLEVRLKTQLADARENFRNRLPESMEDGSEIFESAWRNFIRKRTRALAAMS